MVKTPPTLASFQRLCARTAPPCAGPKSCRAAALAFPYKVSYNIWKHPVLVERMITAMEQNKPRSREKHVTGSGKSVQKRGEGLGSGPVGDAGGRGAQPQHTGGGRSGGARGGGMKLIVLLLVLLLGGGGRLTALLGGQTPSTGQQQPSGPSGGSTGANWTALLSGLGGGRGADGIP